MKNFIILLVLVSLSISCSSSDDVSGGSGNIYGVWEIRKDGVYASANDIVWTNNSIESPCTSYDKYILSSDNKHSLYTYRNENGPCVTFIDAGGVNDKFTINDDKIHFYFDYNTSDEYEAMRWYILEQTSNSMTVKSEWRDESGFVWEIRAMYLVKQ